ncbi:hypothetical protein QAD02_022774 [Eretmocerus hayati]|uniref:Uncharacterized protein n=1 Tax=Eretmocerus hayati TaxID=131215 RepID=A0ACC2PTR9_9HYME|nr:hypothetical protein QAD02_022774 [Eretmocerus hayati]
MTSWQNNPGGGFYPGQQGFAGYPGQPGFQPPYPGGPAGSGGPPPPGFVPPTGIHIPPQPGMYGANYAEDPMRDEVKGFQFNDVSIRQAFVRKVYSILMLQLLITLAFVALFTLHPPAKQYAREHFQLAFVLMIVTVVIIIAMACCTNVRRTAPMNYIFLFIFTLAESVLVGFISSYHEQQYVLMAVGITFVIVVSLTLFAFQTKYDFTGAGTYLFIAVIVLMIAGILMMFFPSKIGTLVLSSFGALLFSFYLVYDTQMMLGGNHKYALSPEEYIFAALNIYMDIINIFLYILSILETSNRD